MGEAHRLAFTPQPAELPTRGRDDSLLAALVEKLPAPGTSWSAEARQAWLNMMSGAFDVVYGAAAGGSMNSASPRSTVQHVAAPRRRPAAKPKAKGKSKSKARPKLAAPGPAFFIDRQHYARARGGERIMPNQVGGYLVDLRGMNGDIAQIIWADDSVGIPKGVVLDITIQDAAE